VQPVLQVVLVERDVRRHVHQLGARAAEQPERGAELRPNDAGVRQHIAGHLQRRPLHLHIQLSMRSMQQQLDLDSLLAFTCCLSAG
jgi:hypothetical protein